MSRVHGTLVLALAATFGLAVPAWAQPPTNRTEARAVLFRPDGKTLLSAGLDGSLRVYEVASGREVRRTEAHQECVYGAALSPDGKHVVTAGGDKLVRLWDAATLKPIRTFEGNQQEVIAVAVSPDGKTVAAGGGDKSIRLWDLATGKLLRRFHGHETKVTGLAFSPDSKLLASGGTAAAVVPGFFIGAIHADQVRLWDPATGKEVRKLSLTGTVVAFNPDDQSVAAGGMFITGMPIGKGVSIQGGGRLGVATTSGKELLSAKGYGTAVAFSPDGKFLATAWGSRQHLGRFVIENETRDRRVGLWEVATGKDVLHPGEDGAIVVAVSPDGRKAAVGRLDGSVHFLDLAPAGWAAGKRADDLTVEAFDRHWAALAGENATSAYESLWALALAGNAAVALLRDKVQPVAPSGPRVRELLAKLDSKRFAVRQAAFGELKKLGAGIEADLRAALKGQASTEVRTRVQSLLEQYAKRPANTDELRQTRTLQALERIGTREARALLGRLAEGAPGAWLTEEARAAVRRMDRRGM